MSNQHPAPVPIRRKKNPAADLPTREEVVSQPVTPESPAPTSLDEIPPPEMRTPPDWFNEKTVIHNVRVPASLKKRLRRAVNQERLATDDNSISETSMTIQALERYLTSKGV